MERGETGDWFNCSSGHILELKMISIFVLAESILLLNNQNSLNKKRLCAVLHNILQFSCKDACKNQSYYLLTTPNLKSCHNSNHYTETLHWHWTLSLPAVIWRTQLATLIINYLDVKSLLRKNAVMPDHFREKCIMSSMEFHQNSSVLFKLTSSKRNLTFSAQLSWAQCFAFLAD